MCLVFGTIRKLLYFLTLEHLFDNHALVKRRMYIMSAVDQIIIASLKQLNKENKVKALAYLEDMLSSLRIPVSTQETKVKSS